MLNYCQTSQLKGKGNENNETAMVLLSEHKTAKDNVISLNNSLAEYALTG